MVYGNMIKQLVDFQKNSFDNSMKLVTTFQNHGEKIFDRVVKQAIWIPEEGKKAIVDWIALCQQGSHDYVETVEKSFQELDALLVGAHGKKGAKAGKERKSP
jgi:hypothetical protein